MQKNHSIILQKTTVKKHWEMPLQNLNKNYDKTNKYAAGIQNITKM